MSYPDDIYAESLHDWLDERDAIEAEIRDAADRFDVPDLAYSSTYGDLPVTAEDFMHGITIPDTPDLPF